MQPIRVETESHSVAAMIGFMEDGTWVFPEYQRKPTAWDNGHKSLFIESVAMGLPVPSIFVAKNGAGRGRDIVDGIQRLSALRGFVSGEFKLHRVQYLPELRDKKFGALGLDLQEQILDTKVVVYEVPRLSPWGVSIGRILFDRLNLPMPLVPGEWIHAAGGVRLDLLAEMVGEYNAGDNDRHVNTSLAAAAASAVLSTLVEDTKYAVHDYKRYDLQLPTGAQFRKGASNDGRGNNMDDRYYTSCAQYVRDLLDADFEALRCKVADRLAKAHAAFPHKVGVNPQNAVNRRSTGVMFVQARVAGAYSSIQQIRSAWDSIPLTGEPRLSVKGHLPHCVALGERFHETGGS